MFSFISKKINQAINMLSPSGNHDVKSFAKNFLEEIKDDIKDVEKKLVNKKSKDPNAPKRAMNPYIFFSIQKRSEIKENNPDLSPVEVTQKIAELWRNMSEKNKEKYKKMSKDDKDRYDVELSKYKSSSDDEEQPKKSRPDNKSGPKRPRSSYIIFCTMKRQEVKDEFPDLKPNQILQKLAGLWKEMTDDEKEKYIKLSEKDKQRFMQEKEDSEHADDSENADEEDEHQDPKSKSKSKDEDNDEQVEEKPKPKKSKSKSKDEDNDEQAEEKPKPKKSAYLNFCDQKRDEVKSENEGIKFGELSKKLGNMWKSLSNEEKKLYE